MSGKGMSQFFSEVFSMSNTQRTKERVSGIAEKSTPASISV